MPTPVATDIESLNGALLQSIAAATPAAIAVWDVRTAPARVVYANHAFLRATDHDAAAALGRGWDVLRATDAAGVEHEIRKAIEAGAPADMELCHVHRDHGAYWGRMRLAPIRNAAGELTHYVGVLSEPDDSGPIAARAPHADAPSPPTDVLVEHIRLAYSRRRGRLERLAVLALEANLPGATGDGGAAMRFEELALERAAAVLPGDAPLSRIGPRRFACVIESCDPTRAAGLAAGLIAEFGACQVGIAIGPDDAAEPAALLRAAVSALEAARSDPERHVRFFGARQDTVHARSAEIQRDLLLALARGEFQLAYQPQVNLATGTITGFEALLRWQHPQFGFVPPDEFIGVAETSRLIVPIGEWVLRSAWQQLQAWERAGHTGLRMAVNVSAIQLAGRKLDTLVGQLSQSSGLPGTRLEIELTERTLIDPSEDIAASLAALKALGVTVAIDDFGSGYSNLAYLSRMPIDCIKIDKMFTMSATNRPTDAAICRTLCELANSLRLRVVAEGIETEGQLAFFRGLHCHEVQGYLLARPLPADDASKLLAANDPLVTPALRRTGERHLLLVDDEPNILSALRRALRPDGYVVHTAESAQHGFEVLARHPVGVVVSDQRMPQMSGTEFLRRVKLLHPRTVRLVLSGYTELQSITGAINEGAIYKFLTKPWNDEQLREQIRIAFEQFELTTETARLERELRTSNARLEELLRTQARSLEIRGSALGFAQDALDAVPVPIVGFDAAGLIAYSNNAADRAFAGDDTLIGRTSDAVFAPDTADALAAGCESRIEIDGRVYLMQPTAVGGETGGRATLVTFLPEAIHA